METKSKSETLTRRNLFRQTGKTALGTAAAGLGLNILSPGMKATANPLRLAYCIL